jgi:hypothetical protein
LYLSRIPKTNDFDTDKDDSKNAVISVVAVGGFQPPFWYRRFPALLGDAASLPRRPRRFDRDARSRHASRRLRGTSAQTF